MDTFPMPSRVFTDAMRDNPVQFAVVREDPTVELTLAERVDARRVLLVASGGCTALTLRRVRPDLDLALFDFNSAQLDLVAQKFEALAAPSGGEPDLSRWNVEDDDPRGLSCCGNFESLFRALRCFVEDFIVPPEELERAFRGAAPLDELTRRLTEHRYWPVAFDVHFQDGLLEAMFGAAAIQHAPPGSYPRYFQAVFERGLRAPGAVDNRFLHHVWLGRYVARDDALPPFLVRPRPLAVPPMTHGSVADVEGLDSFDLLSLSNITDWMSERELRELAGVLTERARPGAVLLLRMLNNPTRLTEALDGWQVDEPLAAELYALDQSLFYSRLVVARRA